MYFASDNWAGAHPQVANAVMSANNGYWPAYGNSDRDTSLDAKFSEIFETDTAVFLVSTGTAANSLALSAMAKPGGVIYAHEMAHVKVDECGAPLFFSPGLQLESVNGALGKIDPKALQQAIETTMGGGLNAGRPSALTITQATESGTVYTIDEIGELVSTLRDNDVTRHLPVHLDGARFANALTALGCTPAQMTWKQGVDMVSFGATKNGCWCAEALLVFKPDLAADMAYLRKRAGQLTSKMRFMTAQFEGYFQNDLWLELAAHANAKAKRLAQIIGNSKSARLAWHPQINEVFAITSSQNLSQWRAQGLVVAPWQSPPMEKQMLNEGEVMFRMVSCFATTHADTDAFADLIG